MFMNMIQESRASSLLHFAWMLRLSNFLPTTGLSIRPLKVKLLAGEQKATESYIASGVPNPANESPE